MHRSTMILHGCSIELQIVENCLQVITQRGKFSPKYSLFSRFLIIFRGGSHEVFPIFLILLSSILCHLDCMGDFWPSCRGPSCLKLGLRGGVRIYYSSFVQYSIFCLFS